eukprot:TRINITY_DN53244_c0_g1_i1.p1 TRINITY_DN53244_c0_g1~~TRINITY_DN53244_c0_g1_i1.p1  ORF type:complete len:133 (+),score=29.57 TRINITY_DN53244_c0_g1_i1:108-506(+)
MLRSLVGSEMCIRDSQRATSLPEDSARRIKAHGSEVEASMSRACKPGFMTDSVAKVAGAITTATGCAPREPTKVPVVWGCLVEGRETYRFLEPTKLGGACMPGSIRGAENACCHAGAPDYLSLIHISSPRDS